MLKYTNMSGKRIFLIQSSGSIAEHTAVTFLDRTYADEVIKHGYYRHEGWDTKTRDQDFGKVKVGDYVLHYCTTDVESYPGQIKNIYEVVSIERIDDDIEDALKKGDISKEEAERLAGFPHVLRLRLQMTLNRGLELSLIRKWVEEGILSTTMNNCGRLGFNVCEVDQKDYETIVEWNKSQPLGPSSALGALLEEDLRRYIRSLPTLESMFGENYKNYKLYEEPDGRITGELYDTKIVGQIDLLYHNDAGDFLVVELKRTEDTPDKAVGQIARYLGWVQDNLGKTKRIEGLLVARSASEELKYAIKALKDCKLFTYEIQFKFRYVS
jgi:hypothetical protein